VNQASLLAALRRSSTPRTLGHAFAPTEIEAKEAFFVDAQLKPLSLRERGWGEGTSAHGAPTP